MRREDQMKDYYSILEVDRSATVEEIKSAFREKAKKLHPDVNNGVNAHEDFIEVGEAYEILSNIQSRNKYDSLCNNSRTNSNTYDDYDFESTQRKAKEQAREYSASSLSDILLNIKNITYELGRSVLLGDRDKPKLSIGDYIGLGFSGLLLSLCLILSFTGVGTIPAIIIAKGVISSMQKGDKMIGIGPLILSTLAAYVIVGLAVTSILSSLFS